jgi:hypothetical protein
MDDQAVIDRVADALYGLPGVIAVSLGGSRAYGAPGPGADWDFAIYYRDHFDPSTIEALGWEGDASPIGGWGGGVFNGGAWLSVEDRHVDVHYRDMAVIERIQFHAEQGHFEIEPLLYHLAGIPTYILLGELALGRTLRGSLPSPRFPAELRPMAAHEWGWRASTLFEYAERYYLKRGQPFQALGMAAQAATCAAHSILAFLGKWATNEKTILAQAGLDDVEAMYTGAASPDEAFRAIRDRCLGALPPYSAF